jgi:hypothetical protein
LSHCAQSISTALRSPESPFPFFPNCTCTDTLYIPIPPRPSWLAVSKLLPVMAPKV